jgi:hypothetical protein
MTHGLLGTQADWIELWRREMAAQGLKHREVDFRARWGDGYCSKLLCGDREPTATTIARMNRVLGIRFDALVGVAGEQQLSDAPRQHGDY